MRYRTLGKTGLSVSALGFGCMRLPMKDNRVDRSLSTPMLRRAVELGINFFDTAVMYCGDDSQAALGEAMEGIRGKVILSTKNHFHTATPSEWRAKLEESLRLMRTDYLDLYHHHGIGWELFEKQLDPAKGGLTKAMLKAKEEGLVRHIGFSFHDTPENLKKLVDTGYYENVIVQYNLLDQSNAEAIAYAHEKGLGVVVMGPVGGGRLGLASAKVAELTGASSTVEAALRFVWGHPGVDVALSGMQTMAMVEENARITERTAPFTEQEIHRLNDLVVERKRKSGLYCSGCRYCVPVCPGLIPIPEFLDALNLSLVYGLDAKAKSKFQDLKAKSKECVACGLCVEKCPQKIDIPARLAEAERRFAD